MADMYSISADSLYAVNQQALHGLFGTKTLARLTAVAAECVRA